MLMVEVEVGRCTSRQPQGAENCFEAGTSRQHVLIGRREQASQLEHRLYTLSLSDISPNAIDTHSNWLACFRLPMQVAFPTSFSKCYPGLVLLLRDVLDSPHQLRSIHLIGGYRLKETSYWEGSTREEILDGISWTLAPPHRLHNVLYYPTVSDADFSDRGLTLRISSS